MVTLDFSLPGVPQMANREPQSVEGTQTFTFALPSSFTLLHSNEDVRLAHTRIFLPTTNRRAPCISIANKTEKGPALFYHYLSHHPHPIHWGGERREGKKNVLQSANLSAQLRRRALEPLPAKSNL